MKMFARTGAKGESMATTAPVLANTFMGFYESKWLNEYNLNKPKVIKKYLDYKFSSNQSQIKDKSDVHCFKLPYIGNLSHYIKIELLKLYKSFVKKILTLS